MINAPKMITGFGSPNNSPLAMLTNESGNPPMPSKPVLPANPDRVRARPEKRKLLPSVITRGLTWVIKISEPLMVPATAPPAKPAATARRILPVLIQTRPVRIEPSPIMEPMEISIPADTITRVIGRAAMAM